MSWKGFLLYFNFFKRASGQVPYGCYSKLFAQIALKGALETEGSSIPRL